MANITTVPDDLAAQLIKNDEFVLDLARFADGILTEKQIRQKYHVFDDAVWEQLAQDDALCERIEACRISRVRSGKTKRELAQLHVTRGPAALAKIMDNPDANARHVCDAVATLDRLAGGERESGPTDSEKFVVIINLDSDTRIKGDKNHGLIPDRVIEHTPEVEPW
jgi:hypothetical protein